MIERRAYPSRLPIRIPVLVLDHTGATMLDYAFTVNLSPGGMQVQGATSDLPSPGTRLQLQWVFPGRSESSSADAELAWRHTSGAVTSAGFRFVAPQHTITAGLAELEHNLRARVLIIAEQPGALARLLESQHDVDHAPDVEHASLEQQAVVLLGPSHSTPDGVRALTRRVAEHPETPVVPVILATEENALAARAALNDLLGARLLRADATDAELESAVAAAVETHLLLSHNQQLSLDLTAACIRLERDNRSMRQELGRARPQLIGRSRAMRDLISRIGQVAEHPTSVHVHGETGTGKELVARAIHDQSPRHAARFVAFNCAGVPESLVQSTLFGHAAGAFTGASNDYQGLFEEAEGGTVFLDEVAELSGLGQASLLRVLQESEVVRVGELQPRPVDVRVISASNQDLHERVHRGQFREDLYYRLVVFDLEVPPLRHRCQDIPRLAQHFVERAASRLDRDVRGLSPECLRLLESHTWPGNVRELENEIEGATIRAQTGGRIEIEHLSEELRLRHGRELPSANSLPEQLEALEHRLIAAALERHDHVVARAARELGLQPDTLRKRIKRLGIT